MNCERCNLPLDWEPADVCDRLSHWKHYSAKLTEKIELYDDDRDKLDVADWLLRTPKIREYNCHGCKRAYNIPPHLDHITCVCGHRSRLRHVGGMNPDQAVIDAAMSFFGNERQAQLAWIAEVVAGQHCLNYTADQIREMIRREMARWVLDDDGWRKVK